MISQHELDIRPPSGFELDLNQLEALNVTIRTQRAENVLLELDQQYDADYPQQFYFDPAEHEKTAEHERTHCHMYVLTFTTTLFVLPPTV